MNILNVIKQAGELQGKMKAVQAELEALEFTGEAGAGVVRLTLSGRGDMLRLAIDPSLMQPADVEMVEDLIRAAFADAKGKLTTVTAEKMSAVTAGLPLPPGLKLF